MQSPYEQPSIPSAKEPARHSSDRMIEGPVFLIGCERSGTTLLRLMLDRHPEIAFNQECDFLVSEVSVAGAFPDVAAYRSKLLESRSFRHTRFRIPEGSDYRALVNDFLCQKLEADDKRIVGATLHRGFSKLRHLWPGARYIYLFRDGRDVASSLVGMGWAGNVYVGAKWWLQVEREWAECQKSLGAERWIEVRYEDLIAGPEAQLRRICDFLGVSFSERVFDYPRDTSYSLPDATQIYKWRQQARPGALQIIEAQIGLQLEARGYELSCKTPPRLGRTAAKLMEWRSRLGVVKHKIATFGIGLFVLEFISRRLGWAAVHRNAQRDIDAIIDRTLK
jgi:hypothetical protein